jgi:hypothetical protein
MNNNKIVKWFLRNGVAISSCTLVAVFGIGYIVWSNPGPSTIGEDVTVGNNLTINGQVKIIGGSPATGKVLTSDAVGLGSWQTSSGIPSGMIAMFDTVCPSGWTRFAALDNRFPQGAAAYGGTGGSAAPTINCTAGSAYCMSTFLSTSCGSSLIVGGVDINPYTKIPNPSCTIAGGSNLPQYLNVVWCKKN